MRRFSGRREVALGLGAYALYLLVRRAVWTPEGRRRARENSERVAALERRLGLDVEPALQALVLPRRRLVSVLNVAYVVLNTFLTVGWLIVLFRRRDPRFHRLRTAALLAHAGAQPVFLLFPTAPPRAARHVVDTIAEVSGVELERAPLVWLYNPIAAMPSIHVAYAVVTAAGTGRRAALAYPPVVAFAVLATGNHYVLDVVAGAALGAVALRLAR